MTRERRGWFRCKPPAGSDQAVLRVGRKEFPLTLLDTSVTGLSAESAVPIDAEVGDCLLLQTVTGWMEVRLARLDSTDQVTQLGLERLREIGDHLPFSLLDFVGGPRGLAALTIALLGGLVLGAAMFAVAAYW